MSYDSFPSLQCLSLVQVSTNVFNASVSYLGLHKLLYKKIRDVPYRLESWNTLRLELTERLDKTVLPDVLKCQVWHVVRKFYLSISRYYYDIWIRCRSFDEFDKFLTNECSFCKTYTFTFIGELHRNEVLDSYITKSLAKDASSFDFRFWYKLACELCLEDCVVRMWEIMPEEDRLWVHSKNFRNPIIAFWSNVNGEIVNVTEILKVHFEDLYKDRCSFFDNFVSYAIYEAQEISVEYFWYKLTDDEKRRRALECANFASEQQITSLFFSAFVRLNKEKQRCVFREEGKSVLDHLLEWPYHEYVFPILEDSWDCFDVWNCMHIFQKIIKEISKQPDVSDPFQNILNKFWPKIPCHFKQDLLQTLGTSGMSTLSVCLLKEVSNETSLDLIAKDLDRKEKGHAQANICLKKWLAHVKPPNYIPGTWRNLQKCL